MTRTRPENSTNVRFLRWAVEVADRVSPALAGGLAIRAFLTPARGRRPDGERSLLAGATPLPLGAGDHALAGWSWGDGPTVALVHGWAGRGAQLGALIPALVARGHRVVTWDAPAHGDTGGRRTTLAGMAGAIAGVAEQVGGFHAVVAHSFGAAAATVAQARGLGATRLAYLAPLLTVQSALDRFARLLDLSRAARDDFDRRLVAANRAEPAALDALELAPAMTTPLLVIHDRDDREVPYGPTMAAAERWPGAHRVSTAGLGHRRLLADPDVVELVADFVATGAAPGRALLDEITRLERELARPDLRWARA